MRTQEKTRKLIQKLQHLIYVLRCHKDIKVHETVDEFDYLQTVAELNVLLEQLDFTAHKLQQLNSILDQIYEKGYCRWRRDVMWLRRYLASVYSDADQVG